MATTSKLVVLSEPLRGQSFELAQEEFTIGRSEDCNLCIPDPTISGKHCTLRRQENGTYVLQDHESTNGSRVNGMRVQSQKLANSDILQLGGVELLFETTEKTVTSVLSTQTNINLATSSGKVPVSEMANFSPFGSRSGLSRGGNRWARIGFSAVGLLLALAIVGVLFWLAKAVFKF